MIGLHYAFDFMFSESRDIIIGSEDPLGLPSGLRLLM